jgi:NAD-dependent deacetylase
MKIVFLTGAGMSAESGIKTFRDADGLWEGHDVMQVASPEGWKQNPEMVLDFYNQRRKQLKEVHPNDGHLAIASLEKEHEVWIITQNVDNLHEKAGSSFVVHLHGELTKVRSVQNEQYILDWENDLFLGDTDPDGYQLRPHIVWFGEMVPELSRAQEIIQDADLVVVIGTSLQVYPAASLMHFAPYRCPVVYIDPKPAVIYNLIQPLHVIEKGASEGMQQLIQWITNEKFGI